MFSPLLILERENGGGEPNQAWSVRYGTLRMPIGVLSVRYGTLRMPIGVLSVRYGTLRMPIGVLVYITKIECNKRPRTNLNLVFRAVLDQRELTAVSYCRSPPLADVTRLKRKDFKRNMNKSLSVCFVLDSLDPKRQRNMNQRQS